MSVQQATNQEEKQWFENLKWKVSVDSCDIISNAEAKLRQLAGASNIQLTISGN